MHPDDACEPRDIAGGKIDLTQQQHEDLGHAQDHEHSALLEQVDQVARREEDVARADDLKEDGDDSKAHHNGKHAGIAATNARPPCSEVLAERLGDDLGRNLERRHLRGNQLPREFGWQLSRAQRRSLRHRRVGFDTGHGQLTPRPMPVRPPPRGSHRHWS